MNKTEKLICLVLGAVLAWYIFSEMGKAKERTTQSQIAEVAAQDDLSSEQPTNRPADQVRNVSTSSASSVVEKEQKKVLPSIPEKIVTLENDEVKLELSTWGAVVKKVTLKKYAKRRGAVSEENPPVEFDFADSPLGAGAEIEAFEVAGVESNAVRFVSGAKSRVIRLGADYRIELEDDGIGGAVSLGLMRMGDSKNDLLSVDSWAMDAGKGKEGVIHHCEGDSPLKGYLVGGLSGGCSGSKSAAGMSERAAIPFPGAQKWVAVKNRFFVTALCSSTAANGGFDATVARDLSAANYRPASVAARVRLADDAGRRTSVFYVGPKKQALLWGLGMKDVMEFGMWRWLCYPLVWVLNFFHSMIPNYGVAIILLTILVRLLFWPLTHKSTVGMKKMQELQPKMKEIEVQGQSAAAPAGDVRALPRGEGEPDELVPADADPDPRLHRALQRASLGGRAALRAVPVDRRPLRAGGSVRVVVPVRRTQHPADSDGRLDGTPERVHAVHGRQEAAADDDGHDAAHDALHVLLVPVRAVALLVPLQPLLDRADVDHPPPDGWRVEEGRGSHGRGHRPSRYAPDAPPQLTAVGYLIVSASLAASGESRRSR